MKDIASILTLIRLGGVLPSPPPGFLNAAPKRRKQLY